MLTFKKPFISLFIFISLLLLILSACGPVAAPSQGSESEAMEHKGEEMEHSDNDGHDGDAMDHSDGEAMEHAHDEGDDEQRDTVPNNGSVIKIVSPTDGLEIKAGSDIVVEVETDNFELGADGNHWHIYVDGESRGMITGVDYDEVVRGLEPGEHELSAIMSIDTHQELEEGDTIKITIVE